MKAATVILLALHYIRWISIHAAREGGDYNWYVLNYDIVVFQSTPPVKAATRQVYAQQFHTLFQSTPPVKAATRLNLRALTAFFISIHAAREGGDRDHNVNT